MKRQGLRTSGASGRQRVPASIAKVLYCAVLIWQLVKPRPWNTAVAKTASSQRPPTPKRELCDNCHATEAKFFATLKNLRLFLCNHHYNKHKFALTAAGWKCEEVK